MLHKKIQKTKRYWIVYFAEEHEIYQDILQENFVDSYNNLTLKSVLTLKYYTGLKKDKLLLLKTDDDSYGHIGEIILSELKAF